MRPFSSVVPGQAHASSAIINKNSQKAIQTLDTITAGISTRKEKLDAGDIEARNTGDGVCFVIELPLESGE